MTNHRNGFEVIPAAEWLARIRAELDAANERRRADIEHRQTELRQGTTDLLERGRR